MVRVAVRLPAWLRDGVDDEAERQDRTFSDVVRIALEEYLQARKKGRE